MPKAVNRRMAVLKKRSPEEWLEGDNLVILRGLALQCLSYDDLASCIGVSLKPPFRLRRHK